MKPIIYKNTELEDSNNINEKKRNYGIDLLRIISMLFIINHHIIFHGGFLSKTKRFSFEFNIFIFLNIICCSGVNIFGMISGFVGFNKYKYSNLLYLLFVTFFYSIFLVLIFKIIYPKSIIIDIKQYLIPIFVTDYWYVNSYFLMYFFIPIINKGINGMNNNYMRNFLLNLFIIFSIIGQLKNYINIFNKKDFLSIKNGFTHSWLIILYFIGSYFGKFYKYNKKNKKYFLFKFIFILFLFGFIRTKIILYKYHKYNHSCKMNIDYTSPSAVIISICFIIIFSSCNINNFYLIKFISFFSRLTFGIYLIHNHTIFRRIIIKKKFIWITKYKSYKIILMEIISSLFLFLFCSIIDYIRYLVFNILRIRELCIIIIDLITILKKF